VAFSGTGTAQLLQWIGMVKQDFRSVKLEKPVSRQGSCRAGLVTLIRRFRVQL
jgi:hypothetical protein